MPLIGFKDKRENVEYLSSICVKWLTENAYTDDISGITLHDECDWEVLIRVQNMLSEIEIDNVFISSRGYRLNHRFPRNYPSSSKFLRFINMDYGTRAREWRGFSFGNRLGCPAPAIIITTGLSVPIECMRHGLVINLNNDPMASRLTKPLTSFGEIEANEPTLG